MQPQLFAEDWRVPARTPFELSSADGVAIVTKAQVANVIRHVGYARNSVGIVTTQSASQLYLKGYPCQEFYARIKVRTDDDVEKEHHVQETHDKDVCETSSLLWMDQRRYERQHPFQFNPIYLHNM